MEAYSESLDLFSNNIEEIGIVKREWVEVSPLTSLTNDSPIEFNLAGNTLRYIDLGDTFLNIKFQILNEDGTAISQGAPVGPINLTLHSLWRQIDVSLSQTPLPSTGTNYPWKSIIDCLLQANSASKETQMQGEFFKKDTAGHMDMAAFGENGGFNWRQAKTAMSQVAELEGPLYLDIAQQNKLILNNVPINIKLWPSVNRFRLMSETPEAGYMINIVEATLKVCQIVVNPKIIVAHDAVLKHNLALYPYMRSDIKTYSLAQGLLNARIDNLYNGEIPSSVVVGLVSGEAYNGSFSKNPYNFKNYDLDLACFYVENNPTPQKGFTPVFSSGVVGNYTTPYLAIFGNRRGSNFGNNISLNDYPQGYALYKFNIDTDYQALKQGSTRLELSFKSPLPEVVSVIVYATFPALMRIDQSRKVLL